MHGHRTSARVPGYVQEPELCTDARPVHRAQHLRRRAGLMQRHWFYADPPDLCKRAGLMRRIFCTGPGLCVGAGIVRGRRTYAPVRRVGRLCVSPVPDQDP